MKRLLAILLFAATLLPHALPGLAQAGQGGGSVPVCCRRGGAHGCAMSMGERARLTAAYGDKRHWHAPHACCPYCPAAAPSLHFEHFAQAAENALFASVQFHPRGVVQTASRWRVARERARGKRGPPAATSI